MLEEDAKFYWKEANTDVAASTKPMGRAEKGNHIYCHINKSM